LCRPNPSGRLLVSSVGRRRSVTLRRCIMYITHNSGHNSGQTDAICIYQPPEPLPRRCFVFGRPKGVCGMPFMRMCPYQMRSEKFNMNTDTTRHTPGRQRCAAAASIASNHITSHHININTIWAREQEDRSSQEHNRMCERIGRVFVLFLSRFLPSATWKC
jgi:hypothetical protein